VADPDGVVVGMGDGVVRMTDARERPAGGADDGEEVGATERGREVVAGDLGIFADKGGLIIRLGENLEARDGFRLGGSVHRRDAEDAEEEEIFATDERRWTQMKTIGS